MKKSALVLEFQFTCKHVFALVVLSYHCEKVLIHAKWKSPSELWQVSFWSSFYNFVASIAWTPSMLPSMCSNMITLMHPHIWRKMKEEWERIVFSDYSSRIIMCFQKLLSVFFLVCEQLCHTNQEHHKVTDAEHSKLTHEVRNKSTGKLLDIKKIQLKLLDPHTSSNVLPPLF